MPGSVLAAALSLLMPVALSICNITRAAASRMASTAR